MTTGDFGHVPVLLAEVLDVLAPRAGGIYVDGTFGGGGYARAILDAAPCTVWAIDRDPAAVGRAETLASHAAGRLHVIQGCFGMMDRLLAERGIHAVDGVTLDLGLSSYQVDDAARGFSFRFDGPLDMRMGPEADGGSAGPSAADLVNDLPERALADVLYRFGEEVKSRRIARAIVAARADRPIRRTGELADIVRAAVGRAHDAIDPATRTFQALRIAVNDELGEIERGLPAAEAVLGPGGRLAVVSFHSLEDRRVKAFLRRRSGHGRATSRHLPEQAGPHRRPSFRLLGRRAVRPGADEVAANPRARSARLRGAERTDAPAWPADPAEWTGA